MYLFVHNLHQLHISTVTFLIPLCILLLEEMFVQVQALQQRVSGSILSQDQKFLNCFETF